MGERLRAGLTELRDRHPAIGDIRGRGLLQGIELVQEDGSPAPDYGAAVTTACFERGLHLNIVQMRSASGVLRIAPPLTMSPEELDKGLSILDEALSSSAPA